MKNIKWLLVVLLSVLAYAIPLNLYASLPVVSETIIPSSDAWNKLKASEFVKLSVNDISRLTGKKLSLKEKISFKVMNKRMKHAIKKDPNLNVEDYLASDRKLGGGWVVLIIFGSIIIIIGLFYLILYLIVNSSSGIP